jgi:beta-fructofuranosidase
MEVDLSRSNAQKLHLLARAGDEKQMVITFDFADKKLIFDRNNADNGYSRGRRECPLLLEDPILRVHIFSDTVSIEIFTDGGRTCMSNTVYPTHGGQGLFLLAEGGEAHIGTLETWAMK